MSILSIGMDTKDIIRVSQLAGLCFDNDDVATARGNAKEMYEKNEKHEEKDEQGKANMTPEQMASEDSNQILDKIAFTQDDERRKRLVFCSPANI